MRCPKWETALQRSKYLDANVRQCASCKGLLLDRKRAEIIKKRVNKDVDQLTEESEQALSEDTVEKVRCPACRNRMDKKLIEELDFHVDECRNCHKAWFDGGELARLQLAFENRPQTEELNRMRQRIANMTAKERSDYEERIANLKDLGMPIEQVMFGATAEIASMYWWRGSQSL